MSESHNNPFRLLAFLVVDDNRDTVVLITHMLRGFGVGYVYSATDAAAGLAILRTKRVDVIICDWRMDPVDGVKFTELVRRSPDSRNPFVPIIMLTGHGVEDLVVDARDAGVTEFLVKPVSPTVLLSRIMAVLKSPRDFIETKRFFGPDRRRKELAYYGQERRVANPKVADTSHPRAGAKLRPGRAPDDQAPDGQAPDGHAPGDGAAGGVQSQAGDPDGPSDEV